MAEISVIIPAYNESGTVGDTVREIQKVFDATRYQYEIIVVNDGSKDDTGREAEEAGARVVSHPINIGYGNAIKTGVLHSRYSLVAMTDADGTYPVAELPKMADLLMERGYDMIVGARQGPHYEGSTGKQIARRAFKFLAEFTAGQEIQDINSGLRVMRKEMVARFLPVASGGFSFSTTTTLIALLTGHFVRHVPIEYYHRQEPSKVKYLRDTLRAAQIMVRAILLFNPIKLFIVYTLGVLISGLVIGFLAAVLNWSAPFALGFIGFVLAAEVILGLGFLAEQKAVNLALVTRFKSPPPGAEPDGRQENG